MANTVKRREFIRSVTMAGASLAIAEPLYSDILLTETGNNGITTTWYTVSFSRETGTFDVLRSNETPLLTGGSVRVNSNRGSRSSADGYRHRFKSGVFSNAMGSGKRLIVYSRDNQKKIDMELHLSLYDKLPVFSVEAFCTNSSSEEIIINSLEPLRALSHEGGILHITGVSKCITNGEMYFDTGQIHEFGSTDGAVTTNDLDGVRLVNEPFPTEGETIHSWWNAGFFSGYQQEGVTLGYLENSVCLGNLLIARPAPDQISCVAESVYAPELALAPGKTVRSNGFMINVGDDPYQSLQNYASVVGKTRQARTSSIVNGWSSWFYTLAQVSEDEVIRQTSFAARHLKPFGLEYIQIDEGYQRWHGEWEGNERFGRGMKWLADQIKHYGFKAGIWISPYVVSEPAAVFQLHPDWFVKNPDGSPQRVGNWAKGQEPPPDEDPKRFCLDITHPEAAQWLHDLIDMIVNEWGYEMIKIDFVAWSILAANQYHDRAYSSAQAYHRGMEIMRAAAGDKCHILECGPGPVTVGLIDSMRIELDINYGYADAAWNTYFNDPASSISAAAKRFYFHRRTWVNDVDHLCMHLLNHRQSEAAATIIGMSGGNMMSGDRLTQLDPYKLEVLKKITPSSGEAAMPVDLFDGPSQSIFAVKVKKPFGEWTVVAFFNVSTTETIEKSVPLDRLWLEPSKRYLTYDFWRQQFSGVVTTEMKVSIPPAGVRLLTVHEELERPQFISTDRHILQGAVELESVTWEESTQTISGISTGPLHTSHNVYVYVPGEHPWTWGGYVLFRDYESFTLKIVHENIIQVHLRFEKSERVAWRINVGEFFK